MGYVLTNYTTQCFDEVSKQTGCFLFDLSLYEKTGKFYAISPVFPNLTELYKGTSPNERAACYVEHLKEVKDNETD